MSAGSTTGSARRPNPGRSTSSSSWTCAVARLVKAVIEERGFQLIESFAEAIAHDVLAAYPSVDEVVVRVRKPAVQLAVPVDHAAVEITRRR